MASHSKCRTSSVILIIVALATLACEAPPRLGSQNSPTAPTPVAGNAVAAIATIKHSVFRQYDLQPGDQVPPLRFETGFSAPLNNLQFVMGGRPDILIKRITGTMGTPDISFPGDVPPFEVTRHFAQHPITMSDSSDFDIQVKNNLAGTAGLEVGAIFD